MKKSSVFIQRVEGVVRRIPKGSTLSYGEVALRAGYKDAARAVGTVMKHNKKKDIPCHRVIKSNGSIGEYNNGGTKRKYMLLKQEGAI